ncbi:MAG: flagellar basal-body MS-ring/collar protein FliF [Gemmatimonadaceae bacterium]
MPDSFKSLLDRIGGPQRVLLGAVVVVAVGLILAIAQWAGAPTWVPLLTNVALENVTTITAKLEQAGVQTRLDRGGSDIMVPVADLAKARVALANGGMPNNGRPGLELFDQPSWGMTDFTQRINYRRALEGELERVVGKMRGIDGAQVHLVMHETDGFAAQERPTEASVVLKLKGETEADVIKGIAHLVASSVDGLTSEHVTIVDDAGHMLSEAEEASSVTGLTSRQLSMQREIEAYIRDKAEKIVGQVVGASNLRVQVNAAMSFDRIERTTATVDPDKQVIAAEQKAQIVPGAQGGAGQNNSSTTYENTRINESFVAAPGTIKRLSVAVLVSERAPDPKAKKGTPPPVPRTVAELEQIKTLVRSAVGADSTRGDVVSVISVPFASANVVNIESQKLDLVKVVQNIQRPALGLLGLLLITVIVLLSLRTLRGPKPVEEPVLALSAGATAAHARAALPQIHIPEIPVLVMPVNGIRDRVAASIQQQPETATRVVRAWLKEA